MNKKWVKKSTTRLVILTLKAKVLHYKCPTFKTDVNIDKICISKKIFSMKKIWEYFIGYFDDFKIKIKV